MNEKRGAIGQHSTATSTVAWNGPGTVARLSNDAGRATFRKMFAWVDSNGDPDVKSSYKFPHHEYTDSVGAANLRACSAAIAVLNGGRGGANIPTSDRQGVYNHVAKHLRDGDQEVPELKSMPEDDDELRYFALEDIEIRDADGDTAPEIRGYAAVFNQWSLPLGFMGVREKIEPGAFSKVLGRKSDIRADFNHDDNYILGRTKAGTLALEEDERGLKVTITPPDTQWARDLMVSMKRGDINQMSFAFRAKKDLWDFNKNPVERSIQEMDEVRAVSVVAYPAYPQTSAKVRALIAEHQAAEFENIIDNEVLKSIMLKRSAGDELLADEIEFVNSSIELLRSVLPEPTVGEEPSEYDIAIRARYEAEQLLLEAESMS